MTTCQICWTEFAPSLSACPVCLVQKDKPIKALSPLEKATRNFARGLRIMGVLEQIGAASLLLLIAMILIPGVSNATPETRTQAWKATAAMLGLCGGGAVFLFFIGKKLRRYEKMAWTATMVMVAMAIVINVMRFNPIALMIPGIYLFGLIHPLSRQIIANRKAAEQQNFVS